MCVCTRVCVYVCVHLIKFILVHLMKRKAKQSEIISLCLIQYPNERCEDNASRQLSSLPLLGAPLNKYRRGTLALLGTPTVYSIPHV